jgi:hypothetical protein
VQSISIRNLPCNAEAERERKSLVKFAMDATPKSFVLILPAETQAPVATSAPVDTRITSSHLTCSPVSAHVRCGSFYVLIRPTSPRAHTPSLHPAAIMPIARLVSFHRIHHVDVSFAVDDPHSIPLRLSPIKRCKPKISCHGAL